MSQKFYIDSALIARRGACSAGRARFEQVFGTGRVAFNKRNWELADKKMLNLTWLAARVLGWHAIDKLEDSVGANNVYAPSPLGFSTKRLFTKKYSNILYEAIKAKLEAKAEA